jgi:Glycosyltransferases involved in cell wall biogenesis
MDTARGPLVSVVVPVYNVAPHVAEAIASLKAQTLRDFEALIVDDGSTDGSDRAVIAAVDGDARFRVIRQANQGLSGARNTGIAAAKGDFLAFLDGDDALAPGFWRRWSGRSGARGPTGRPAALPCCSPMAARSPIRPCMPAPIPAPPAACR